jgi:ethanolaminephosphotransferase
MFDHGADALSSVTLSMSLASLLGFIGSAYYVFIIIAITTGFFFATLEEYYCGRLDLPPFNGVSDGCVLIVLVGILSGIFGCRTWSLKIFSSVSIGHLLLWAFFLSFILTIITK